MANLILPGTMMWPMVWNGATGFSNFTAVTASGHLRAWVLRIPRTGTLNRVGFRISTVGNNPDNGVTVSFQGIDSSGKPDGVQDQFRSGIAVAANTWVTSGLMTDDGTDGGNKRSVTRGEWMAIVLENTSFTAGDSWTPTRLAFGNVTRLFPYTTEYDGAAWSGNSVAFGANFGLQYDDDVWEPIDGALPLDALHGNNYDASDNPDEKGMQWTAPFGGVAIGFVGVWRAGNGATGGDFEWHLYDEDDNELASTTYSTPLNLSLVGDHIYFTSVESVEIVQGATYRQTLEATHASNTIQLLAGVPDSTDFLTAMPFGTLGVAIERQNGGSWTERTDGRQYYMGLLFTELAGGGPVGRGLYDARGRYHGRGQYFG